MNFLIEQVKKIDYICLILMFLEVLFGTGLLFTMTAANAVSHLFSSGLAFGMAIMQVPNIIHSLDGESHSRETVE